MGQDRDGHEDEIEDRKAEGDALPRPVAPGEHHGDHNEKGPQHGNPGGHAEKAQSRADRDKFGDQSQKVAEDQVSHREKAPETSESGVDQLGMPAFRGGAEPDRHLLDHKRHHECEGDKGQEKADAVSRARLGVGNHAGPIVLPQHDQDAGANEEPEKP
jgi:hypothetical protein